MKRLMLVMAIACGVLAVPFAPAIAPSFAAAATAPVGVQDFEFESYSADYFLSRDAEGHSTLKTVETFVARFPLFDQNRGIIRAIPNDYDGVPLRTNVESVVDENGAAVPYEQIVRSGFTELALGTDDYVHGLVTYTITYTQENVVREFADTDSDEFYWDTNGTGFNQPFGSVSARVAVDPALTEYLTGNNACYQGVQGSSETCEIAHEPNEAGDVFTATVSNLAPTENLTVVIGFTRGTFVQVPAETTDDGVNWPIGDPPWWVGAGGVLLSIFTVLGTTFTIIWRFVRPASSKGSGIIIPQYTVPKGVNLLESADIAGRAWTGVPAQIVSFAVRGKLRILDYPVTKSGAKFTLQLLDPTGVDGQELELLTALFGSGADLVVGAVREVGVIDDGAARAVSAVQSGVRKRLLSRGFKVKRSSAAGFLIAAVMFLLIFVATGLFIFGFLFGAFNGWNLFAMVAAFFAVFLCVGFAFRPPVLTRSGAEWSDYLLGMRDYLQLAEADRFRMLQSPEGALRVRAEGLDPSNPAEKVKLYEKLLPFAVLWGIEREWAKELTINYGDSSPDWFVSSGAFDATVFSHAMGSLSSTAVVRATPSSSGSSWSGSSGGSFSGGSRGGGFSGGGGGGGGGGGR